MYEAAPAADILKWPDGHRFASRAGARSYNRHRFALRAGARSYNRRRFVSQIVGAASPHSGVVPERGDNACRDLKSNFQAEE